MGRKTIKISCLLTFLILPLLVGLFSFYPVAKTGLSGVFYSIDPDVHYLSNSLEYIKLGQIQYIDHPGTPTILLHSLFMAPFRLYAKFILGQPFIDWAFANYSFLFFFARLMQTLLLTTAVAIFLLSIKKATESVFAVFLSWILVLLFTPILNFGSYIGPEALSLLITSVWLLFLAQFLKDRSAFYLPALGFVAGVAVANKVTNGLLLIVSPLLVLVLKELGIKQKILNFLLTGFSSVISFILFTWPIREKYQVLARWFYLLITSTEVHAGGKRSLLDIPSYILSVKQLASRESWAVLVFVSIFLLVVFLNLFRKIKIKSTENIVFAVFFLGTLVFAKYNLSHYQLANYLPLVFLAMWIIRRVPKLVHVLLALLLLPAMMNVVVDRSKVVLSAGQKAVKLQTFVDSNPPDEATLWVWARSRDFAYIWSRGWGGGIFSEQISKERPDLLELKTGFEKVRTSQSSEAPLFDVCWDHLYIQTSSLESFLDKYPDTPFSHQKIKGTDVTLVESDHCTK